MVIILPETKIKGRTGWTESVAANSCIETEHWGAWRLPGSSRSCPEGGEVGKERTAWGTAKTEVPFDSTSEQSVSVVPSWIRWGSVLSAAAVLPGLPLPLGGREQ